eukprot:TRINITY_DN1626_c1_g1_i10.p4 TRINITY_DN1626_c1_g1~~TRINITY_DN1626_c1_g1_i10.p4  ORF type:complete len:101 (+),score=7.87 TRINITY_DN1626_c1_g1_i10:397-699(+)
MREARCEITLARVSNKNRYALDWPACSNGTMAWDVAGQSEAAKYRVAGVRWLCGGWRNFCRAVWCVGVSCCLMSKSTSAGDVLELTLGSCSPSLANPAVR